MAMTEQQLLAKERQLEFQEIQLKWMRKHPHDYMPSQENATALVNYLTQYGLGISEQNLEQAFIVLRANGYNFRKAGTVLGAEDDGSLPPVPKYMLAVSKLETERDIRDLPIEISREWYRGKDSALFKARIEAVYRKARQQG